MTLSAPRGAVTALVGPNGSGKTTLMLMLAGLLAPDAGSISINGVNLANDPRAARRELGWMPDTLGVWETLTTSEILNSVARLYGVDRSAAQTRTQELLELVGLQEFAQRPARVLSRGQQQRLSLARALVHDPSVLILDEPASGLDPDSRLRLRSLLRGFAQEGRTVLVSSHDLGELDEFSDHVVIVRDGKTVREQSLTEADASDRTWSLRALDPAALRSALTSLGMTYGVDPDTRREALTVSLNSDAAAAALLRSLIEADVPIVTFAPASGALEETYLRAVGPHRSKGTYRTKGGHPPVGHGPDATDAPNPATTTEEQR